MRNRIRCFCFFILVALLATPAFPQAAAPASELLTKLKALPGVVDVQPAPAGRGRRAGAPSQPGREVYLLLFQQPVDHTNPAAGTFRQRVYISHVGYDKPVLLGTEGYAAGGVGGGELQQILAGNQVTVEHRYFGQSVPSPLDWKYLTVKNAADDMHAVVTALKTLYPGKWVATGTSKGGQTSLFYKSYYPNDVDATVAYVAPVNIGQEDPRINEFIATVGDAATRAKIRDFQIALFKHEDDIITLLKAENRGTYAMGIAKAYEYGVLEYPYYFWQYGLAPDTIPAADAPIPALLAAYNRANTIHYYSDQGKKQFEPFLYQAFTEIGYYNYDVTDFKQYMKAFTFKNGDEPTNLDICPDGTKDKIVYNANTMAFVFNFLQYKANNVIYIYGETDAWSATQMQLLGRTNALKIVVTGAHHNASIRAFSPEQKDLFFNTMDQWLGMKLPRQ